MVPYICKRAGATYSVHNQSVIQESAPYNRILEFKGPDKITDLHSFC